MGTGISRFFRATKGLLFRRPCRVVVLGLDGAGKTSLLYKLELGTDIQPGPTACFNVETIKYKCVKFTVFDLSGHADNRNAWPCYFPNCDAVIFVVDASDRSRVDEAARELSGILTHEDMNAAKLLVLANKQDKPDCMTIGELQERLNLTSATRISHRIEKSVISSGEGIYEGLDWICEEATDNEDGLDFVAFEKSTKNHATR